MTEPNGLAVHPGLEAILRRLMPEERDHLKANLLEDGECEEYIKTWRGFIVDGHNRMELCNELGWKEGEHYRVKALPPDWSEEQVIHYMRRRQVGRRNSSPHERDALLYAIYLETAERRHFGGALRRIAKVVGDAGGVSERTAERAIELGKMVDQLPFTIRRFHHFGKCQLSKQHVRKLLGCDRLEEIEQSLIDGRAKTTFGAYRQVTGEWLRQPKSDGKEKEQPAQKDARNQVVPEALDPAFQARQLFRANVRLINQMIADIEELAGSPGGGYLQDEQNTVLVDLNNVKTALQVTAPHVICPFCAGKGCKEQPSKTTIWCFGRGYLTKLQKGISDERWIALDEKLKANQLYEERLAALK